MSAPGAGLVVIGAGTMGAWTALVARRAGQDVLLLDARGPGNDRSSSGDETRILRSSHGSDGFYAAWSREARRAWIELGEQARLPLFQPCGVLWFARHEGGFESTSLATLRAAGIPAERLLPGEIEARWSGVATDDLAFALFEPEAGLLLARRGLAAVAAALDAEGGRLELGEARPGRADGDRLREVVLPDGTRRAGDAFVFACGPWLPALFPDLLGPLIRVTRQDVPTFTVPPGERRFDAPGFPCWIDHATGAYGIGAGEGRGFKCASDLDGPDWDPATGDRIPDPVAIDQARAYLARRFPPLAGAPLAEARVCQYESTPDAEFVIDRHPTWRNVWLVGGGSGHGFKHGPVIGRYVVELLDGAAGEPRFAVRRHHEPRAAELRPGAAAVG